jgi:two-component sensor histidine kinase
MSFAYLEHLSDACLVINERDEIIFWNNSFLLISELKEREIKKIKTFKELVQFDEEISELAIESKFKFSNNKNGFGLVRSASVENTKIIVIKDLSVEANLHSKYHSQLDELKKTNQKLEIIVAERTAELRRSNKYLFDLLDSFKQAIFLVDSNGKIDTDKGLNLSGVMDAFPGQIEELFLSQMPADQTLKWLKLLFSLALPFEEMTALAPQELVFEKQTFKMTYYPFYQNQNELDAIVIAMTNISEEAKVRDELENKNKIAASLYKASQGGNRFSVAVEEITDLLNALSQSDISDEAFRAKLHGLKGLFSYYGPAGFDLDIHAIEISQESIRNKQVLLKDISLNFKSQLQLLLQLLPHLKPGHKIVQEKDLSEIFNSQSLKDVRRLFFPYVFLDLKEICQSMSEFVNELCNSEGKEIALYQVEGERIYLENEMFSLINQFLIQGLRNSIAHGFGFGNIKNKIRIRILEVSQRLLLEIQTDGKIMERNDSISPISGLRQGRKLLEQLAQENHSELKLDVDSINGISKFQLLLPIKNIKRAENV